MLVSFLRCIFVYIKRLDQLKIMDKIELALSRYTDFFHFEQLCIEVMGYYGYPRIKKIGGYKDDGVDALSSDIYHDDTQFTRVFQFTMQKDIKGKIKNTINKLRINGVSFDELILVTSQIVNNIDSLTKSFRLENTKTLQIYDLNTFVTIINQHKELLIRYFPNLNTQIEADFFRDNIFSDSAEDQLNMSMIKSTLLYSLSPELKTQQQRKNLFDKAVLSLISMVDEGGSIDEIMDEFHKKFGKILMEEQVRASLQRLSSKNLCISVENRYKASKKAKMEMMEGIEHVEQRTNALIDDIIAQTHVVATGIKCSKDDDKQMMLNIRKTLNLFFKFYGTDLALNADVISSDLVRKQELIKILSDNLPVDLSECLIYSLGCILSNPTDEQAATISLWAKAFIGTQLMKLDPMLSAFQKNAFGDKIYILDTDFVLNCMVKHARFSEVYSYLLNELLRMKCQIYIPDSVVREVIIHAEYSQRNYNYFKNTFEAMDESIVYEKVQNVFVIDYFVSQLKGKADFSENSFSSYIHNIYEPSDPYNYMLEVMHSVLSKDIVIGDTSLCDKANIELGELETLTQAIYAETIKTYKAGYRSEEENMQIAKTDAELYLIARNLNKDQPADNNNMLLFGKAYLITNSTRSIRCAKKNNILSKVIAKPSILIALISEIGMFDVSNKSIINLLDNPFLAEIVEENWDGMKLLMESGVDLRGKSLPRLKRDLKHVIHALMTADVNLDDRDEENMDIPQMEDLEQYVHYANILHSQGYRLIPAAEKLIGTFEKMRADAESQQEVNERIQEEIEKIGKRKQGYLRRIGKIDSRKSKKLIKK